MGSRGPTRTPGPTFGSAMADIIVLAEPTNSPFRVTFASAQIGVRKKLEFALWGTDHNDASGDRK